MSGEQTSRKEKPVTELSPHIAQAQEEVRAKGMCGAVFDDAEGDELMCLRDPHGGRHGRDGDQD